MSGTFVQRLLTFTFNLGTGDYGAGAPQTFSLTAASGALAAANATLAGAGAARAASTSGQLAASAAGVNASGQTNTLAQPLRALVQIEQANLPSTGAAHMRIWGMNLNHMNTLSKAGLVFDARQNTVTVQAGDSVNGMVTVFSGLIVEAYPDMTAQPETNFYIFATPTNVIQMKPVTPISYPGAADAPTVFGAIATSAGLTLENNGVQGVLQSPYFQGTAWQQLRDACQAFNCFGYVEGTTGTLAVWPKTGARATANPNVISPATGMINYPSFQTTKVSVRQIFSPTNLHKYGQKVRVQSELQAANGTFVVSGALTLSLSCNLPNGPWEVDLDLYPVMTP